MNLCEIWGMLFGFIGVMIFSLMLLMMCIVVFEFNLLFNGFGCVFVVVVLVGLLLWWCCELLLSCV